MLVVVMADRRYTEKNRDLHETAVEFVRSIMKKCKNRVIKQPFNIEKVHTQYKSIDVLALIKQGNRKYALLIEDKTSTSMHDDQLPRYKKIVEEDFPDHTHLLVYLNTWEISRARDLDAEKAGYHVYRRKDLLEVFGKGQDEIGNAIFRDFHDYLETKDARYNAFLEKRVDDWVKEWDAWEGFFNKLQDRMPSEKLDWVVSITGQAVNWFCFWGFTEYEGCNTYLEIHKKRDGRYFLAFKVSDVPKDREPRQVRQDLYERLMESAENSGWDFVDKPRRFGSGHSMIFCQTKEDSSDRWLAKNAEGKLDLETTIKNLKKAEKILHEAIQQPVS